MNKEKQKTNWNIFKDTIYSLANSQGFYGRLKQHIESMSENELTETISRVNNLDIKFNDSLDVVMFLEQ